jgi:hypothetical protein
MQTKRFPRHSREWCRHQLDLLRARDRCRSLASERDHLVQKIQELGGRRPNSLDSAMQIAGAKERLRYVVGDLQTARFRAETAAEACGENAGVEGFFRQSEPARHRGSVKLLPPATMARTTTAQDVFRKRYGSADYICKVMLPAGR